jgi:hypothetical protein
MKLDIQLKYVKGLMNVKKLLIIICINSMMGAGYRGGGYRGYRGQGVEPCFQNHKLNTKKL